jgi:small subunit ribosomal protein S16
LSVKIRLKRFGTTRKPFYRIVVADSRTARDGRVLEEVGYYHPIAKEDKQVSLKVERVAEWLSKGAQPTAVVRSLINRTKKAKA